MKVLIATPDLYKEDYPEFTKNKTGFGLMVYDILTSVSAREETYLVSNKFSEGHPDDGILRHSLWDVVCNSRISDLADGIRDFLKYQQPIKGRLKYFFYKLNKGYIRRVIRDLRPDIVHIHSIGFSSLPYIEVCRELRVPFLVTLHGVIGVVPSTPATEEDRLLEKEFISGLAERGELATIVSSGSKRMVLSNYSDDASDFIEVVGNGTSFQASSACNRNLSNFPCEGIAEFLEKNIDAYKFIVVGNLCKRRNQVQVLEALAELKRLTDRKFVAVFCGSDKLNGAFQEKVAALCLENDVFYAGYISRAYIDFVYCWANCNIVASHEEGFGLSILEAASFGVPTVVFSDLGAVEDLYSPKSMLRVDERSTEALAQGLLDAMSTEWNVDEIRNHASQFSMENMAEKYIDAYAHVLLRQSGSCQE